MNKTQLKKSLASLPQKELVQLVVDLYGSYPDVKENLDSLFAVDKEAARKDALEKYKAIIRNEYFPAKGREMCRVSVCKKAIADYKKLKPIIAPPSIMYFRMNWRTYLKADLRNA